MTEQTTETPPVPDVSEGRRLLTEASVPEWHVVVRSMATPFNPYAPDARLIHNGGINLAKVGSDADASLIVWLRNNAAALLDAAEANQRVRELHHRTTEEGYAAVCVWGDCDHDKAGECPTRDFDVCEHCMAVVDATGFADSGEVWPSAVLWPCPTIRMLGGESE